MAANQDQGVIAQFNFIEQDTNPQEGSLSQENPSNTAGQSNDNAAPNPEPDRSLNLNLNLSPGGRDTSNLERSISLPASLAMNEKGPLPPKDFLSLSPCSSLPAGPEPLQHKSQARQGLQVVTYAEYHQKRLVESMAREQRLLLPGPPQPQQPVLQIQHPHQVNMALPQLGNQPVMAPPLIMVLPQTVHQIHHQAVMQMSPPTFDPQNQVYPQPNLRDALASATTKAALSDALDHLASQPDQTIWRTILATGEGSSNFIPPHMDVAANRLKQPLIPRPEVHPSIVIPPSGSNSMVPVEDPPESESVAKRMREMQEKGLENGHELMRQMPGVAFKVDGTFQENRPDGFLYKYLLGDVTIICNCHGEFLSPGGFVEHASGCEMNNPMKHIKVNTDSL